MIKAEKPEVDFVSLGAAHFRGIDSQHVAVNGLDVGVVADQIGQSPLPQVGQLPFVEGIGAVRVCEKESEKKGAISKFMSAST